MCVSVCFCRSGAIIHGTTLPWWRGKRGWREDRRLCPKTLYCPATSACESLPPAAFASAAPHRGGEGTASMHERPNGFCTLRKEAQWLCIGFVNLARPNHQQPKPRRAGKKPCVVLEPVCKFIHAPVVMMMQGQRVCEDGLRQRRRHSKNSGPTDYRKFSSTQTSHFTKLVTGAVYIY